MRISRKNNTFWPSFTVMELVIVMLLSGIVIGMTLLYFTQFQHYIRQQFSASEEYLCSGQFNTVFQQDIDNSSEVYYQSPALIRVIQDENEIHYEFDRDKIIRKLKNVNDTFRLTTNNLSVHEMENYNDLVDFVEFEINIIKVHPQQVSFVKEYNSKTLFTTLNSRR